jgi:LysR family glycine cleavage system transcriptional activator
MFPSAVTPLCSPDFAARHGGLAKPEDLLAVPRIGPQEEWAAWFAETGVGDRETPVRPRWSADLQTIEVVSALAGHGVALGSPILFAPEIRLIRPFEAVVAFNAGHWLVYPEDRRRSAKIKAFREWMLRILAADPSTAAHAGRSPRRPMPRGVTEK